MNSVVYALALNVLRRCWSHYTVLLVLPCLILIRHVIRRCAFVRALSWIPGPPSLPVLGNSLSLTGGQVEFFRLLVTCAKRYGAVFKLWIGMRPFVFITNADKAQPILSSMHHIDKSYEYSFLYPWLGTGLLTSTGSKWHQRRKLLTPTFHYTILEEFVEPIVEQSRVLVELLSSKVNAPAFNVMTYTKLCALDVICVTAMGKSVNAQRNGDQKYVKAVDGMNEILQRRFITPWLKPDFIFNWSHYGKRQREYVRTINDFVTSVIREKKMERSRLSELEELAYKKKRNRAFLELLLAAADNGEALTDEEIRDEVNTFMFAGHDTTSVAIAWCLYVLGKEPLVQEKILNEYNDIIGCETPTYRNIQRLDYLESVIKEVMRLYPVVPLIARDIKHDVPIGKNKTILPGVTALIFIPSLHRDPEYFPSPNEFKPERFMNKSQELKNPFAYIPFGAGPRNCIGSKFAMVELKIVLHAILKNYIVTSVAAEEDMQLYSEIVLLNKGGIEIELQRRV